MTLPVTIPNTFANATTSIPLANLDANFVTIYGAVNGIGNGAEALANVNISGGTVANAAVSNTSVSATTLNTSGAVVFNDAGADVDFRVESDTVDHALFVEGSSGNVGIGTSSPIAPLTVASSTTLVGGSPSIVFTGESNTERIQVRAAGATGGTPVVLVAASRGTVASPTAIQSGNALGYYQFGGYDGTVFTRGAWIQGIADGDYSVTNWGSHLVFSTTPTSSTTIVERARITSDGYLRMASGTGGIQFGGDTAAANALDDYEEGTFTPTAVGGTTAGTTTYTVQNGYYTKIGRQVNVTLLVAYSALTGTGNLTIGNLPFTIANLTQNAPVGAVLTDTLNWTSGTAIVAEGQPNTTYILIVCLADDAGAAGQQCVNETAGIRVTMTYFAAT